MPCIFSFRGVLALSVLAGLPFAVSAAGRPAAAEERVEASAPDPRGPTFAHDVAPILFEHCTTCHHRGGLAPFSLMTYADARPWARAIRQAVVSGSMPPWKPTPGYGGPFAGERRLTAGEVGIVQRWVDGGAVRGDPADLPPAPRPVDDWPLGAPDVVVTMPEAYVLRAEGPDEYRNFVAPIPVTSPRYVRAFHFRPRSRAVHHARLLLDRSGSARRLARVDPEPGYDDRLAGDAEFPEGHLLAWAPGRVPAFTPDDIAWRLEPGTDLVMQLHLPTVGVAEPIQAEVGFYFQAAPPRRTPAVVLLGDKTIDIPAGDSRHVVEDEYRLPVDVEALAVYPHAHFLGKDLQAFASLPDGSRRWLVRIADWDFDWQDEYRFADPVRLPRGTTLHLRYVYDNSAGNPANPSHPPRRVRYGRQSTDEMAELVVQVVTRTRADHDLLTRDFARKANAIDVAGAEKRVRDEPGSFRAHHELAVYYLEAGRLDESASRFERALRLDPGFAPAHYNLGLIHAERRQLEAAAGRFRQAVASDPAHARAHVGLGVTLQAMGRPDAAIEHYRRAVAIEPELADAHHNLAVALQALGRVGDAVRSYRRVLALTPGDAGVHFTLAGALAAERRPAEAMRHYRRAVAGQPREPAFLNGLAWMLATHTDAALRDPAEATRLAETAASLTGRRHVLVLDTLAAAHAAAGRYREAVEAAEAALALVPAGEAPEVRAGIRGRLALYARGRPYRQPGGR